MLEHLSRFSRRSILLIAAVITVVIGFADYQTGPLLAFSFFYLLPIALVAWYTTRPIAITFAIVAAISWSISDYITNDLYPSPVYAVWNGLVRLAIFLFTAQILTALRRALNHQVELARTDGLTGVGNARAFRERAEIELRRARRYKRPISIVYIDVDDFKRVNDTFGHAAGDELLELIANALSQRARVEDVVARMGGDEFAVLAVEAGPEGASIAAAALRDQLNEAVKRAGRSVTFSIGVVSYPSAPDSVEHMLRAADNAMYAVKNTSKDGVRIDILT